MSFTLIAGPCVIESSHLALQVAEQVKAITDRLGISYVFKASFDKANRSSGTSFRGPGVDAGLAVLAEVKQQLGLPVLTDIHESQQAAPVAEVVDVLQIPAFLCRQTDLLLAAAEATRGTEKTINSGFSCTIRATTGSLGETNSPASLCTSLIIPAMGERMLRCSS